MRMRYLLIAGAAALALGLAGCGSSDDDDSTADAPTGTTPTTPPAASPVAHTADVALGKTEIAALLAALPDAGSSDTVEVAAGESATRMGVVFTCDSAHDCVFTVTNSLDTILASVMTYKLPDADDPMATAMTPPGPQDTFAELNDGSDESIRNLVGAQDGTTTEPTLTPTELIGMGIGGPGVLDASKAGLRSDFQANGAALADADGDDPVEAAGPGDPPALRMGTTITGAMDAIDPTDDMASAPDGWVMKTLFRDWGDTAGDGDGGFETAAIVVKNLGEGTPYPFDRKLSGKYVNMDAQNMFALSILASGDDPTVTTLGTSVSINESDAAAASVQWANMVFDADSLVPAQSQDLNVNAGENVHGVVLRRSGPVPVHHGWSSG